jgi:peroxiredoxin
MYWVALSGATFYFFYAVGINFPTVGMALVSFIPSGFIIWLFISKKAQTSANQTLLTFSGFGGLALLLVGSVNFSFYLFSLYALGFILWLLFVFWYSYLPVRESRILLTGNSLPELQFKTYNNEPFYASSLLGQKVIYLFYRGNWCPVCMAQIKEVAEQYKDLKEYGAEMLLISSQSQDKSKELSEKIGMDFIFLSDEENKMANKLEIDHINGVPIGNIPGYGEDTVLPTVIITDEHGKIIFLDQTDNFRIRPEPSTFLQVLDVQNA